MRLDELDAAILRSLSEDARRSLRDIAGLVGSTPTTVGARLEKLEAAGVVTGFAARLDAAHMPGRVRLIEGHVAPGTADAVLRAVRDQPGVIEAALTQDGRLVVVIHVADLDTEDAIVAALGAAGATRLGAVAARRVTGPTPTHLFAQASVVSEPCAQCGKTVTDDAIAQTVDGRRVAFCCRSCERLYLDRYQALKAAAGDT